MDSSKSLPSSVEAERSILGAIFLLNDCLYQCDRLNTEDFFVGYHRNIYQAMLELSEEQKPIDFVTVTDRLTEKKQLSIFNGVSGTEYVMGLTDGLPKTRNVQSYVDIVLNYSRKRQIIYIVSQTLASAYDEQSKPEKIIEHLDKKILEIAASKKSEPKKLCDILPEADARVEEHRSVSQDREAVGYPSGINALDKITKGYMRREVTVIAGETSDGKSSLLRQGVISCAFLGIPQIVFSREVSREQIAIDLKTFISGVYPAHVRDSRKMDLIEQSRFKNEANKILRQWPLWIDDSRSLHIYDLFHKARRLIRLEGSKFKDSFMVWIDYVQLIQGSGNNQTERTEDVCAGIWTLADNEKIPVAALSQLNRDSDKGKKQRPTLRRLKNASRIEQDAHCLVCPYQPEDDRGNVTPELSEIIILKQRHGPRGIIPVRFDQDELIFKER